MAGPFSGHANVLQEMAAYSKGVPYYPQQRYIDKNLAPETMPVESLRALAKAQREATEKGFLRPEVADLMLANTLTEGRPDDFGVNDDVNPKSRAYSMVAPHEAARAEFVKGINFGDAITDSDLEGLERQAAQKQSKYDWRGHNAAKAAAILSDKQTLADKIRPGGDPMEVIKLWNGTGPLTERHAARVSVVQELLSHPKNAAIKQLYDSFLRDRSLR